MGKFQCHKHMIYDRECPKCIPEPPRHSAKDKLAPPAPPQLRNPNAGHYHSGVIVWVAVMMLFFTFGVLVGWKMHG